jgi:hypothetical protein
MTAARKRFEFRCTHHGDDTIDSRKLERRVEEDKIISRRKQETTNTNVRGCLYYMTLVWKRLGEAWIWRVGVRSGYSPEWPYSFDSSDSVET